MGLGPLLEQVQVAVDVLDEFDFLSQEMFREVNTIGSKANNVAIAHAVVEMKAAVEKIREILQRWRLYRSRDRKVREWSYNEYILPRIPQEWRAHRSGASLRRPRRAVLLPTAPGEDHPGRW